MCQMDRLIEAAVHLGEVDSISKPLAAGQKAQNIELNVAGREFHCVAGGGENLKTAPPEHRHMPTHFPPH